MWFGLVSLFPEMFKAITDAGVSRKAAAGGQIDLAFWNPRDFTQDKHRTVDDKPYGGGPGMLMKVEPLSKAIDAAQASARARFGKAATVIYLSPQGRTFEQQDITHWRELQHIVLVCGRYEGVDQRVIDSKVDELWSIGDFVLSGGEIAAMAIIDAIARTLPGSLGNALSAQDDSFSRGLLEYPHYTRPEIYNDQAVPEVLLSGDHQAIERWRLKQALGNTWLKRKDLLQTKALSEFEKNLLQSFIDEQEE